MPFTIIRPFNCVGTGEKRALCDKEILSGNVKLAMSHVVPDLVQKIIKGQDPLHILGSGKQIRHYTYAGDLARGIRLCIENPNAINEDFNLSTALQQQYSNLPKKYGEKSILTNHLNTLRISHLNTMFKKEYRMFQKQKIIEL